MNTTRRAITTRSPGRSCTAFGCSSPKPIRAEPLHALVNDLLLSPMGRRDWPLRFWSKERLMSVEARRGYVAPDLAPLP